MGDTIFQNDEVIVFLNILTMDMEQYFFVNEIAPIFCPFPSEKELKNIEVVILPNKRHQNHIGIR